jgi:hypothetical protein
MTNLKPEPINMSDEVVAAGNIGWDRLRLGIPDRKIGEQLSQADVSCFYCITNPYREESRVHKYLSVHEVANYSARPHECIRYPLVMKPRTIAQLLCITTSLTITTILTAFPSDSLNSQLHVGGTYALFRTTKELQSSPLKIQRKDILVSHDRLHRCSTKMERPITTPVLLSSSQTHTCEKKYVDESGI